MTTLTIDAGTLRHLDLTPDLTSETCHLYQCAGTCPVDVVAVDGELRHVWWCTCCNSQYTTRYVPVACPDGLPWCVNHERNGWPRHRAASAYVPAEVGSDHDGGTVLVRSAVGATAGPGDLPLIWLGAASWNDWERLGGGVGLTAAHAREIGQRLIQLANEAEEAQR